MLGWCGYLHIDPCQLLHVLIMCACVHLHQCLGPLFFPLAIVQEGQSSGDNRVEGVNIIDCINPGYCCQCLNHWCLREKFVVVDFNSESIKCCSCQVLSLQI